VVEELDDEEFDAGLSEVQSSDESEKEMDNIRKSQLDLGEEMCLTNETPEEAVVSNISKVPMNKKSHYDSKAAFVIAPGESKIPTNLMREEHWDRKAFPCQLPSGRFGFHNERSEKASLQQMVKQRLWNVDTRFVRNTASVFAFLYVIEKQQLEQKINISYLKGKKTHGNEN